MAIAAPASRPSLTEGLRPPELIDLKNPSRAAALGPVIPG
jgi:hypothetical protein